MHLETISPSQITTYLACPRKFAFRYVERLPPAWKSAALAFGSAVHSALEVFHQRRLDGDTPEPNDIAAAFRIDWAAEAAGDLKLKDGENMLALAELGEALVRLYVAEHANLAVQAAEWPFEVPLADPETGEVLGPTLRGVLDLVLAGDELVEIKTAARAYAQNQLDVNLQFSAYAFAYRQIVGRDPKFSVVGLIKTKKPRIDRYPVTRTVVDDHRFVRIAAAVARAIEVEAFPPNPSWMCTDCEYGPVCEAWAQPPTRPVADDSRRHLPVVQEGAVP